MKFLVSLGPTPARPDGISMPQSTTLLEDSRRRGSAWKAWLVPLILGGIALTLALVTRYVWIKSTEIGLSCAARAAALVVRGRAWSMIRIHQLDGWGLVALGAGLISLVTRWYWLALVALVVGPDRPGALQHRAGGGRPARGIAADRPALKESAPGADARARPAARVGTTQISAMVFSGVSLMKT